MQLFLLRYFLTAHEKPETENEIHIETSRESNEKGAEGFGKKRLFLLMILRPFLLIIKLYRLIDTIRIL